MIGHVQSAKPSGLGVLEVECVGEGVTSSLLTKDDGPLSPGTHLTVQATGRRKSTGCHTHVMWPHPPPNTGVSEDAIELWLLGVLSTDVGYLGLGVMRHEAWVVVSHRATCLGHVTHC